MLETAVREAGIECSRLQLVDVVIFDRGQTGEKGGGCQKMIPEQCSRTVWYSTGNEASITLLAKDINGREAILLQATPNKLEESWRSRRK